MRRKVQREGSVRRRQDMAESMFTSLLGMLDPRTVEGMAGSLGASGQSVSQGLKSSIAAVLGGLASKSEDPHALRTILDLPSGVSEGTTLSQIAQAASDPNSPLMSGCKRLFSGIFGNSADAVTDAVSAGSGLRTGTASSLLSMAAPMVLGFISNRVR